MTQRPPSEKIAEAMRLLKEAQGEISAAVKADRTASRGRLNAELWKISKMQTLFPQYFSVAGQDMFLDQYVFETKRNGVFVDVGAYDGVTGSNSLFFEVFRGWSGLLIEPVPTHLERIQGWRSAQALGHAIGAENDQEEFMTVRQGFTQMSGFLDEYDPEALARVRAHPEHKERVTRLPRRKLGDILAEEGIEQVDLLSMDLRGGAAEIIAGLDLEACQIEVFCIDNPSHDASLHKLMKSRGYRMLEFLGTDEIFGRKE